MNAVVKLDSRPVNTSAHAALSRSGQIASQLTKVRQSLRRPFEEAAALAAESPGWWRPIFDCRSSEDIGAPRSDRERAYRIGELRSALSKLPERRRLTALESSLAETAGPFDDPSTKMLLGFMVDAFPNARPHNPDAYLATAFHELGVSGYSPHVVAAACAEIVRSATFLPTVAEILARCEAVRSKAETQRSLCAQALKASTAWAHELAELEASR